MTSVVAEQRALLDAGASVLALPVWPGDDETAPWIGAGATEVVDTLGVDVFGALEREQATGKAGQVVSIPVLGSGRGAGDVDGEIDITRVVLVGLGDGSTAAHRRAGAALARSLRGVDRVASTVTAASDDTGLRAFVEGAVLATYALDGYRGAEPDAAKAPLRELVLVHPADRAAEVETAAAIAAAGWLARDLVHTPANVKDPAWLAARAAELGAQQSLDVRVREEKALAAEGFGGILAVGMGSVRPPRLIALRYSPSSAGSDTPHVVLVGKGITFDSGGLSLKPRDAMIPMKTDMSGGAVVLGVMSALRALDVPVQVTGLVAAAENLPGAAAQRTGDVITQYGGTTVEVLNTDAEGRLVLADAIAYAVAELAPTVIVDVATLTGAATVGLGRTHAAIYATNDALAAALTTAGEAAGERLWHLPLVDDYRGALDSAVADLANIATERVSAGSIVAALFLEHFAGDVAWAHLDIAGPGRADKDKDEVVRGGTAFGLRALLYWLEAGAPCTD